MEEVAAHLQGADAAVFAAGAGPGSGAGRKDTVDRDAAVLFADAAVRAGVRRHVIVSSMGAEREPRRRRRLRRLPARQGQGRRVRPRAWTPWTGRSCAPASLTNDPGTGLVRLEAHTGRGAIRATTWPP